jgi:hypothetical protein
MRYPYGKGRNAWVVNRDIVAFYWYFSLREMYLLEEWQLIVLIFLQILKEAYKQLHLSKLQSLVQFSPRPICL